MKRFFQKLLHNCTGAVTVFVTLLLIPAVLVSGTGVDIARIYTARSVLQDGNQLAMAQFFERDFSAGISGFPEGHGAHP